MKIEFILFLIMAFSIGLILGSIYTTVECNHAREKDIYIIKTYTQKCCQCPTTPYIEVDVNEKINITFNN